MIREPSCARGQAWLLQSCCYIQAQACFWCRAQEVPKEQQPAPSRPVTSPSRPLTRSGTAPAASQVLLQSNVRLCCTYAVPKVMCQAGCHSTWVIAHGVNCCTFVGYRNASHDLVCHLVHDFVHDCLHLANKLVSHHIGVNSFSGVVSD